MDRASWMGENWFQRSIQWAVRKPSALAMSFSGKRHQQRGAAWNGWEVLGTPIAEGSRGLQRMGAPGGEARQPFRAMESSDSLVTLWVLVLKNAF